MSINDIQRYPGQILGIQKNDLERATAISCELDDQNRGVVRIVDAAPFAYNNSTDKLKVEFDESDFSTSILRGVSTDGLPGMLIDDTKNFESDMFLDKLIKINVDGIAYYRKVASNTKHAIFFSSPLEAPERALVVHGNVNGGQITIHYHEFGEGGNNYSVEFIKHEINGIPVSAELNGYLLTVKLEVNDQNEPISAGMDTAAKISLLPEFEAQMTGSGGVPELTNTPIQFTGGSDGVYASEGTEYQILLG